MRLDGRDGDPWGVRVVPNKFPALQAEGEVQATGHGIYDRMDGIGSHEVVIESPDHFASLGTLPAAAVADVLHAYRQRLVALKADPRFEYVLVSRTTGRRRARRSSIRTRSSSPPPSCRSWWWRSWRARSATTG
jgi:galactose-1-phosphate uridylyltransferase